MEEKEVIVVKKAKSEAPLPRRKPKIRIPRRVPSVVIPPRQIIYTTPDKTTCVECTCFPKEDPYVKPKKLNPCQKSPRTLYELAADVVDSLKFPEAFGWSEEDVANWMAVVVGLPEYRECITDNYINGMRLLMLEDPSHLPEINIHDFNHIKRVTAHVRSVFGVDFVKFCRSVGLPPRKPLTHTTWFKSRTGPEWGIRRNWTRSDILRWMKIIMPEPVYIDHWDLVWYRKPEFPKVKFARIQQPKSQVVIPRYVKITSEKEICREYQVPRKFKIQTGIKDELQLIWMEHRPGSPSLVKRKPKVKKVKVTIPKETSLMPKKMDLSGLKGNELILARRKMPKAKFLV